MKNNKNYFFIVGLFVFAFSSCFKEDNEGPQIQSMALNGNLGQDFQVSPGDSLNFTFTISDWNELNQMKANIHAADDGHSHNGVVDTLPPVPNVGLWVDTRIINLHGTTQTMNMLYVVPDTISGIWHFEVQAMDKFGNEAQEVVVELDVQ